jgi:hypothetical protein
MMVHIHVVLRPYLLEGVGGEGDVIVVERGI